MPMSQKDKADRFRALHQGPRAFVIANPWDAGSARILESVGFEALATTSSGHAATLGRLDGQVAREEALTHAASVAAAVTVPVSADLEGGFAADPPGVAATITEAISAGLAGCSIEDIDRRADDPVYELGLATERVRAAAEVAHAGPRRLVLTARADGLVYGRTLDESITRLQAFQEAGADVLFAPGVTELDDIGRVLSSVDRPLNVLALPGGPTVAQLAAAGVARVSVGGGFAYAALGALVEAGRELLDEGTYGYWERAAVGRQAARDAFTQQ
jgi:2-methylisocitrate lyase-like PEP mutase family enzyme